MSVGGYGNCTPYSSHLISITTREQLLRCTSLQVLTINVLMGPCLMNTQYLVDR